MKTYKGSCQCGAVKFEVEMEEIKKAMACNCSRCSKLGWLLVFVPAAKFTLLQGEGNLTEYRFGEKTIAHLFCKTCGIESFSRGEDHEGNKTVAINVRCLEGVDPKELTVTEFDGKSI